MTFAQAASSALLFALLALPTGCIELLQMIDQRSPGDTNASTPSDGATDDGSSGNGTEQIPVVSLRISNVTPQVNEQVVLTCTATNDAPGQLTYDFQPASGRLSVDRLRGTALFVVNESDIGVAFSFTCTATNDAGTSQPSNAQSVIPTSSVLPP